MYDTTIESPPVLDKPTAKIKNRERISTSTPEVISAASPISNNINTSPVHVAEWEMLEASISQNLGMNVSIMKGHVFINGVGPISGNGIDGQRFVDHFPGLSRVVASTKGHS